VFAEEDLEASIERLKSARLAMAAFRVDTQIFDPEADVQGQMGLLNTLQIQLAEALIARGLLTGEAPASDPRILRLTRRIDVIEAQINSERSKFGVISTNGDQDFASLLSEYEALTIDLEFAQQSYLATLAAYDSARAESQRKSRYLAPFLEPTLPESAIYPKRLTVFGLVALFSGLCWALFALFYYSARDRRS
jgi:capsular polysaccharide transport system permease protein